VTEQDVWSYWDFSRHFIDQIVREDDQVPFRSDAFIRYLLRIDHLSLANGEVKVNTLAYAGLMQDAVAPHQDKIALVRDHVSNRASRDVLDRIFQRARAASGITTGATVSSTCSTSTTSRSVPAT
jgi:hypothetical protein